MTTIPATPEGHYTYRFTRLKNGRVRGDLYLPASYARPRRRVLADTMQHAYDQIRALVSIILQAESLGISEKTYRQDYLRQDRRP